MDMSKLMIDITGNNVEETFDINESREYVHIGIRNIEKKYYVN